MPGTGNPVLLPEVLGAEACAEGLVLDLRIPESLAYFAGHFPEAPIVAGVAQIQWAAHFARERLGLGLAFHHLEAVKFRELMLPGQRLQLRLRYQPEAAKLSFVFRSEDIEFSSGRIYFHGNPV